MIKKQGYIATPTLYNGFMYMPGWLLFNHLSEAYLAMVQRAIFHDVKITRDGGPDGRFVL